MAPKLIAAEAEAPPIPAVVPQPVPPRRRYGLFSAATMQTLSDEGEEGRWQNGALYNALPPWVATVALSGGEPYLQPMFWPGGIDCAQQQTNVDDGLTKADWRGHTEWVDGTANAFTVTAAVQCNGAPEDGAGMRAMAQQRLEWSEERLVEYTAWTGMAGNNQFWNNDDWANDATVDGVNADPPAVALAGLTRKLRGYGQYLDQQLETPGVIHAPAWVAPIMHNHLRLDGAVYRTVLDDAVAFGNGYPHTGLGGTQDLTLAEWVWLFATGPLVIRRGPIRVYGPHYTQATARSFTVAERAYSIATEGPVAAVRMRLQPSI